ncbi:hypothetical protein [Anaeroarcus burkinensis]|uniref:hypothetical protein n=1 Tax=Anaeroarcus burkinensis TaxID=82376 RepID=UPI000487E41E|nr:hypothetical protein [Anaeroarcus burkinensis]
MELDWVQFFSLSTVSAIFAFCLNQLLAWFERRKRIKAASLLLLHEVNRHVYWLEQLNNGNNSPVELMNLLPDIEWEKLKYDMFHIGYEKFDILVEHYLEMESIRFLSRKIEDKGHRRIPKQRIQKHLDIAKRAHLLLFNLSGKNSTKFSKMQ